MVEGGPRGPSKMAAVRLRVTPLAGYLLALAVYSTLMLIVTLDPDLDPQQQQQEEGVSRGHQAPQHHPAATFPHAPLTRPRRAAMRVRRVDDFYNWMKVPQTSCDKLLSLGGTYCKGGVDNDKYVCLDDDVALRPGNCTVYSFGIGNDATFDDQASYFGCEVYMFDPSVNKTVIINTNLKNQHFYPIGLHVTHFNSSFNIQYTDNYTEFIQGEFDTYDSIRSRLGHQQRPVHYLKLDIENTEWSVLPYMMERGLLAGVRQLAVEVHTMDIITAPPHQVVKLLQRYWEVMQALSQQGFLRASYRPTVVLESLYHVPGHNRTIPTCFEVLFLRRGVVAAPVS
ncbi:probable methyltransferase-like protein 24 [Procambarus clarkii]|uniref:probable methyltransferase-like protein 24 n=1 Tax=Procambarus clarkii TaxID=6728 RepID=UPI0037424C88